MSSSLFLRDVSQYGETLLSVFNDVCSDSDISHYNIILSQYSLDSMRGIRYLFKYNHHMHHDSKAMFIDALIRWLIVTDMTKISIQHPISDEVKTIDSKRFMFVSIASIATYRVKLIPDQIIIRVTEQDLHHWIHNKLFTNTSTSPAKYQWCEVNIPTSTMTPLISRSDNFDISDIKDVIIRHQPSFKDNYLLDVILYHDYLRNVVKGQIRRSMIEYSNEICRNNLKRMGDCDGDI